MRGHSARVADLSAMVAAELELSDEDIELVRTAGRCTNREDRHPEEILNKQAAHRRGNAR